jgi:hypothetical protein
VLRTLPEDDCEGVAGAVGELKGALESGALVAAAWSGELLDGFTGFGMEGACDGEACF